MNQGNASEFRVVEVGSTHVADKDENMKAVVIVHHLIATARLISTDLGIGKICPGKISFQAGVRGGGGILRVRFWILRSEGPVPLLELISYDFLCITAALKTHG